MAWHTIKENNSTPSTCSQERVEGFSLTSYLDTIQSEPVRSNPTQEKSCSSGSKTEYYQNSQSGMTSAHWTDDLGGEQLAFWPEDFHVKTSVRRVKAQELPAHVQGFGRSMRESLMKCGLSLSLPKTHLCFALGGLESSSKTWPRWGMMLDGELSELGTSVRPTKETECGSLPTPKAGDYKKKSRNKDYHANRDYDLPNRLVRIGHPPSKTGFWGWYHPSLSEWMMGWPIGWTGLKPLAMDNVRLWQQTP